MFGQGLPGIGFWLGHPEAVQDRCHLVGCQTPLLGLYLFQAAFFDLFP